MAPGPRSVPVDTLHLHGTPGEPLIAPLPHQLRQRPVQRYEPVRLPALSLLVDHAFFWDTRPGDAGIHTLALRARYDGAPSEEVVLVVRLAHDEQE